MYKCTDCGHEYDIKPDYCDCGNNVFEQIEIIDKTDRPQNRVRKTGIKKSDRKSDILSWLIFTSCIIFSILSIIFIDIGDKTVEVAENIQKQTKVEIPSIDELWVNTKAIPKQSEEKPIIKSIINISKPIEQGKQKKVKVEPTVSPNTVSNQKTTKPTMTQEQKDKIVKRLTTPKLSETEKKPVIDEAAIKRELVSYKIALRNKIASNIDFASVIGDGNCAVSFKINDKGNLIDRKFSIQSNNNSLNDVVYSAMIQNPSFNPPPQGYKNETLTLNVKMYGGNFEVSLK